MSAATGGGLTADLIARAIIAAARSYGDDPQRALQSRAGTMRRSVMPAVGALLQETDLSRARLGKILDCNPRNLSRASKAPGYAEAERAARGAVAYARWRPEAAESVVGAAPTPSPSAGEAPDAVASSPDPEPVAPPSPPAGGEPGSLARKLAALHNGKSPSAIHPPPPTPLPTSPPAQRAREPEFQRPPRPPLSPAPPIAGSLETRILELLQEGSANTQGMATVLDVKESAVCATLRILLHAGQVVADPVPPEGLRAQRWRLCA